jgi:hypothetical protein
LSAFQLLSGLREAEKPLGEAQGGVLRSGGDSRSVLKAEPEGRSVLTIVQFLRVEEHCNRT